MVQLRGYQHGSERRQSLVDAGCECALAEWKTVRPKVSWLVAVSHCVQQNVMSRRQAAIVVGIAQAMSAPGCLYGLVSDDVMAYRSQTHHDSLSSAGWCSADLCSGPSQNVQREPASKHLLQPGLSVYDPRWIFDGVRA